MQPKLLGVKPSPRKTKKYVATFDDGTITHFGGKGCGDFIMYSAQDRKLADKKRATYIARHGATETWTDPTTPASLSRFILWEHRTLSQALRKYASHFGKR